MAGLTRTVVELEKLGLYDELIKKYVTDADKVISDEVAKKIETVAFDEDNNKIQFYTIGQPVGASTPAFEVQLPEVDFTEVNRAIQDINDKIGSVAEGKTVVGLIDEVSDALVNEKDATKDGSLAKQIADVADSVDNLADVATSGAASDVSIEDKEDKIESTTVEGALAEIVDKADTNASDIADIKTEIGKKASDKDSATGIYKEIADASDTVNAKVGDLETLTTTAKSDVVSAVNEIKQTVDDATTAGKVTLETASTPTDGYLKTYVISQGETEVGKIDIPKDLVVQSGKIVVDPTDELQGTYIELTIANQEEPIYINVKDLVDIYTAEKDATQVQIAVSDTNEISATIVSGSIGTTELADNAVTTAKIADGNVTKDKLSETVQTTLDKADSALQASDISDLESNVELLQEDLAEGGNTYKKIAQNASDISDLQNELGAISYASETDIRALFAESKNETEE